MQLPRGKGGIVSESQMEKSRHELLSDVESQATAILRDHGIEPDVAEQASTAIADHLANHWGGQVISFPKEYLFKMAERDIRIYDEFNGSNQPELARRYGMSVRGIYKLISRVRKRELDRRQSRLPF